MVVLVGDMSRAGVSRDEHGRCGGRPSAPPGQANGRIIPWPVGGERRQRHLSPSSGIRPSSSAPARRGCRTRPRGGEPVVSATSSMRSSPDSASRPDPQDVGFGFVVFVADIADDLLDQVLHRDHARGAAVFVDHERGLHTVARSCVPSGRRRRGWRATPPPAPPERTAGSPRARVGTSKTCLTCTMPTVSSRSPSTTGNREKPVSTPRRSGRRRCRRSAAPRSSSGGSSVPRRCATRSAASGPPAAPSPIAPRRAELRTSEPSSCGERAERSSSAGSMPSRRRIQFAVPLGSLITGVNIIENTTAARP